MSVSPSEKVQVATANGIATVTINNPGANTWDLESLPALEAVVHALNARSDIIHRKKYGTFLTKTDRISNYKIYPETKRIA